MRCLLLILSLSAASPFAAAENTTSSSNSSWVSPKLVFAHMLLCYSAFGPMGSSPASIAGYQREIEYAHNKGLDGLAIEALSSSSVFVQSAVGMYAACNAHNRALPPGRSPFRLFVIVNFQGTTLRLEHVVSYYTAFWNDTCALRIADRPVISSWGGATWATGGANESTRWERDVFAPIAAAGLPRPFFVPFVYSSSGSVYTFAAQRNTLAQFTPLDGLWYWGAAALGSTVAAYANATVAACREVTKFAIVPVSAPYSAHSGHRNASGGNNRYFQGNGGKGVSDAWLSHVASQPDMVIFTTWNDLLEGHYVGPYAATDWGRDTVTGWLPHGPNLFPHEAYIDLSAHFMRWYRLPGGSPEPPIAPEQEGVLYWYNLQPIANPCPGDSIGPLVKSSQPGYPLEDAVYVTALLAFPANVSIYGGSSGAATTFSLPAGRSSVQVASAPGWPRVIVQRVGVVLANVTGSEAINSTEQASGVCTMQTFSGSVRWAPSLAPVPPPSPSQSCSSSSSPTVTGVPTSATTLPVPTVLASALSSSTVSAMASAVSLVGGTASLSPSATATAARPSTASTGGDTVNAQSTAVPDGSVLFSAGTIGLAVGCCVGVVAVAAVALVLRWRWRRHHRDKFAAGALPREWHAPLPRPSASAFQGENVLRAATQGGSKDTNQPPRHQMESTAVS